MRPCALAERARARASHVVSPRPVEECAVVEAAVVGWVRGTDAAQMGPGVR